MESQQLNLDVISNNLANVNTTGFKKSKIEFQDLLYETTRAPGAEQGNGNLLPTGIQIGHGSRVVATSKVFTEGELTQTGERLDMAIQGDGFFQVQMPDGTLAYTRDGALKTSSNGQITTSDGLPVQGGFQPIPTGTTGVTISPDGQFTTTGANGTSNFQVRWSGLPTRPDCSPWAAICTWKPSPPARRKPARPTRRASAACSRATWKCPTSKSSRKWST